MKHRVTYSMRTVRSTKVDHILCRSCNLIEIISYKSVPEESTVRLQGMVVCRLNVQAELRIKWWKLKRKNAFWLQGGAETGIGRSGGSSDSYG